MSQNGMQTSFEIQNDDYEFGASGNDTADSMPTLASVFDMSIEELLAEIRSIGGTIT